MSARFFLRRAVRDGPDAFPVDEGYGTPTWLVVTLLHWRTWINVVTVGLAPFLWAVAPYLASPPAATDSFLEVAQYHYALAPWLLVRPLRLLAALPLTFWFLDRLFRMPRY